MAKTISIPVPGGLMAHGQVLKSVVLREPTFEEFMDHGDPTVWTRAPDGSVFAVENGVAIKAYMAACLVEPKDPLLLENGGFRLARAVKDAILGFFHDDVSETALSKTSPTSSSSSAGGEPISSTP